MRSLVKIPTLDYLVIGHITRDLLPQGNQIGGTAAYAALTAKHFGLNTGIVTAFDPALNPKSLDGIHLSVDHSGNTTTFSNIETPEGRKQIIHEIGPKLTPENLPDQWRSTPIVHLGPVANEINNEIIDLFPNSKICLTPQGWYRKWDQAGHVSYQDWADQSQHLSKAAATIISIDDINHNEDLIYEMAFGTSVLVVTEGAQGVRVYWNGDQKRFAAPTVPVIDTIGAGDIFAASFFIRLHQTNNPWEAARFAVRLSAISVTRKGLQSVPTSSEIEEAKVEIL
jgi:sugar/nucleoside kinase (ribokinase family)